jgi:hypothetical protein
MCKVMDWIRMCQDTVKWWAVVNMAMNTQGVKMRHHLVPAGEYNKFLSTFSTNQFKSICSHSCCR